MKENDSERHDQSWVEYEAISPDGTNGEGGKEVAKGERLLFFHEIEKAAVDKMKFDD